LPFEDLVDAGAAHVESAGYLCRGEASGAELAGCFFEFGGGQGDGLAGHAAFDRDFVDNAVVLAV
jgi:hypothetical protein